MKRKPKKQKRPETINIRVSLAEKKKIIALAKQYANGSLSEWLRIAGTR